MPRRRQKNPLLGRIIGISVAAHVIALPILAHFGAFKKIQEHFVQTQMVVLPPPDSVHEKPVEKKETKTAKAKVASKGKTASNHAQSHASHSNLPQPHIAVAAGDKTGGDDGNSAQEGNGKVGEVPIDPNAGKPAVEKNTVAAQPEKQPEKPVVTEAKPVEKQPEKPVVAEKQPEKPVAPVEPVKPIVPKEPVFTAAQPLDDGQPKPAIPDDLRSDAIDKTVVIEFTVGEDGTPMAVKAVQSTGNDELDRRALDAAKKWRFKPATRDGQPVVGRVRLSIEFQVS